MNGVWSGCSKLFQKVSSNDPVGFTNQMFWFMICDENLIYYVIYAAAAVKCVHAH